MVGSMAQELGGYPVEIGDRIFDIYDERWLTVRQVYSNRFMVEIKTAQGPTTRTYDYNGVGARRRGRTAYWHDPRICEPAKGAENWLEQRRILKAITEQVVKLPIQQSIAAAEPEDLSQFTQLEAAQRQMVLDSPDLLEQPADSGEPSQSDRDAAFQNHVASVIARQKAQAKTTGQ